MNRPADGDAVRPTAGSPVPLPDEAPDGFAVLDVETTGFGEHDRVVQIAIARADATGRMQDEWSTLVDPLRNPGPVHVHGITPERLIGAPTFPEVAAHVAGLLAGRVLVAHNADFDYRMLHTELARTPVPDPVRWRLCTMRLARRAGVPVDSYSLAALSEHFRVHNPGAHDARHDVWTTGRLLHLLLAETPGAGLPLTRCGGAAEWAGPRRVASRSAGFVPVGRWQPGGPLVQGMRVLVVGPTLASRGLLRDRALEAGISWTSRLDDASLVVGDPADRDRTPSSRWAAVRASGLPVVAEETFDALLGRVLAGAPEPEAPPSPESGTTVPEPEPVAPGWPHPLPPEAHVVRLQVTWPLDAPGLLVRARLEAPDGALPGPLDLLTPEHPVGDDGAVHLVARTLGEAGLRVALSDLAPGYAQVCVTAERADGGDLTEVGEVSLRVRGRQVRWDSEVTPAGAGPVPLARFTRDGGHWRFTAGPAGSG